MAFSTSSLVFEVKRRKPELIRPIKPTPYEFKNLSDIDDQQGLRFHIPGLLIFKKNEVMKAEDPVTVIREAISKALVSYYPLAGRLREGPNRKLMVECTGEGVMFTEASAGVSLEELGEPLQPPFPSLENLLYDVPGSSGVLDSPLLLIQVTRLTCGGFIFASRLNHAVSDAAGLVQFMKAIGEIARGAIHLSVEPVWNRELLSARDPPCVTCLHHKCDQMPDPKGVAMPQTDEMLDRCFFFGPQEVFALRKSIPSHLSKSTWFEIITACIWRCRAVALNLDPNDEMRLLCAISGRGKVNPKLPAGYYGNTFVFSIAVSTAGKLCQNPLEYALQLVKKAKDEVTEEYIRSYTDLMVIKGRPHVAAVPGTYLVSDVSRLGFIDVDFGWGKPVYGGPAKGDVGDVPGVTTFYIHRRNNKGEEGIAAPICLPVDAMETFVVELERMIREPEIIA
ncbi:hypothetical protein ACHQM5_007003 [Ranunculus cassubicifolius]